MRGSARDARGLPVRGMAVGLLALASWAVGALRPTDAQMKHEMKGGMKPEMKMEMATEGIFEGVGEVKAVLPDKSQIVVGHEEIKGFMEAMPMGMGYAVESKDLLKGLRPGDRIRFKIDAAKKAIVAIERVEEKTGSSY